MSAALLRPADILVDSMRGRSSTWTRIRLNLRNIPADERPQQEELEVDFDPWAGLAGSGNPQVNQRPPDSRARLCGTLLAC
jgi:hypothetical protein